MRGDRSARGFLPMVPPGKLYSYPGDVSKKEQDYPITVRKLIDNKVGPKLSPFVSPTKEAPTAQSIMSPLL
jgi:hypothetical protein